MPSDLETSLVRIERLVGGRPTALGTGFVVSDGLVVTCTHVVAGLTGRRLYPGLRAVFRTSGEAPPLELPPEYLGRQDEDDIAILRVSGGLPAGAAPAPFGPSLGVDGHRFRTLGYPAAGDIDGVPEQGTIIGRTRRFNGVPLIHLSSAVVTEGFSGAPLIDQVTRQVVGMITETLPPDDLGRLGRSGFAIPSEEIRKACPAVQWGETNPYRGLLPFVEENARYFAGRDGVIEELADHFRRNPRFLAVVGASGSGKTSVVRAGLVPRLLQTPAPGGGRHRVVTFRPERGPADALRAALAAEAGPPPADGEDVWTYLGRVADDDADARWVLFCDQFEAVFIDIPEEVRAGFLDGLARVVGGARPIGVVLAARDDFYHQLLASPLGGYLKAGQLPLLPMSAGEMRKAIEVPAKRVGLRVQEGLAGAIVADLAGSRHALPLLEFTLEQLWKLREDGRLTHDAYHQIGRAVGALGRWATDAYRKLSPEEQEIARRVFFRLIRFGEDGVPDTPCPMPLARLAEVGNPDDVRRVINALADARLLITGRNPAQGEVVEIIHAALLREWEELKAWIDDEHRHFLTWRQRLQSPLSAWLANRDRAALLRGTLLQEAVRWRKKYPGELRADEDRYVRASQADRARRRRRAERAAVRLRDVRRMSAVHQLAEDPTRRVALLAEFEDPAGARGWMEAAADTLRTPVWEAAIPAADKGDYQFLACFGGGDLLVGRTLDLGDHILVWQVGRPRRPWQTEVRTYNDSPSTQTTKCWLFRDPGRDRLLALSGDAVLQIYRVEENPPGVNPGIWFSEPTPDGGAELVACQAVRAEVEQTVDCPLGPDDSPASPVVAAGFAWRESRLVTGHEDGWIRVWDLATSPPSVRAVNFFGKMKPQAVVSPDGSRAIFWPDGAQGFATMIPLLEDGDPPQTLHPNVQTAAFHPGGRHVAGIDGKTSRVNVWSLEEGGPFREWQVEGEVVTAVAFNPAGDQLITATTSGRVALWPFPGNREEYLTTTGFWPPETLFNEDGMAVSLHSPPAHAPLVWRPHYRRVQRILLSEEGRMLTVADDGTAALWPAGPAGMPAVFRHEGRVTASAFSPDGRWVATAAAGGTPRVWRTDRVADPAVLPKPPGDYGGESIDRIVAEPSPDGPVYWIWFGHQMLRRWAPGDTGREDVFSFRHFTPGALRTSGRTDPYLRWMYWQAEGAEACVFLLRGPQKPFRLRGVPGKVRDLALSPDGAVVLVVTETGDAYLATTDPVEARPFGASGLGIRTAAFDPAGERIATGSQDGVLRVWDRAGGLLAQIEIVPGAISEIQFAPDGGWLLAEGESGYVFAEATGGRSIHIPARQARFIHGGREVLALGGGDALTIDREGVWTARRIGMRPTGRATISPDGSWIVIERHEDDPEVWGMARGVEPIVLRGAGSRGGGGLTEVTAGPDGKVVLTGHTDGNVAVWPIDVDPVSLLDRLRRSTSYRLTAEERMQLLGAGFEAPRTDDERTAGGPQPE